MGRVEGTISLSRTLFVSTDGVVKADVAVENAVISGIVVGNVVATECIQITETGRVVGDLRAPRVIVTTGARVRGQVSAGDLPAAQEASPTPGVQALGRSMKPLYARMGLPARRPLAQPPVARASAAPGQASIGAASAASSGQASSLEAVADGAAQSVARRQAANVIAKKKPVQANRRRD